MKQYFGYTEFRSRQEEFIDCILSGQDCFGIMPTAAGKSMCFQLPALMLEGTTIVISPMISLMQDQVKHLTKNGVAAASVNSSNSMEENDAAIQMARSGKLKLLYVSPERLVTESFTEMCGGLVIPLVVVDEAHCITEWGRSNFRPEYLRIGGFIAGLKKRPAVAAVTATATEDIRNDVIGSLGMIDHPVIITNFDRPNLYFEVRWPKGKDEELLAEYKGNFSRSGCAIVYCSEIAAVRRVAEMLVGQGFRAGCYHGSLSAEERGQAQKSFMSGKLNVMVATVAFGMGIDKRDVSLVVHYNIPDGLERYYQEAGRAGRDGEPARCILFYSEKDLSRLSYFADQGTFEETRRKQKRLEEMSAYSAPFGKHCLRTLLLGYFGEKTDGDCGNCGNCLRDYITEDVTLTALKILAGIGSLKDNGVILGRAELPGLLLGLPMSEELTRLNAYGILRGEDSSRLDAVIGRLEEAGFFIAGSDGQSCVLLPKGEEFAREKGRLLMSFKKPAPVKPTLSESSKKRLFNQIYTMSSLKFRASNTSVSVRLPNGVIENVCGALPVNMGELRAVDGMTEELAEDCGEIITREVIKLLEGH